MKRAWRPQTTNAGEVSPAFAFVDCGFVPTVTGGPVDEVPFVHRIEWVKATCSIELVARGGQVLAAGEASSQAPSLRILSPNGGAIRAALPQDITLVPALSWMAPVPGQNRQEFHIPVARQM